MKTKKRHKKRETSPATMLVEEVAALRRDLRATVRAYAARLEIDLAESMKAVASTKRAETLARDQLHEIRELTIMLRKRKLKPEKGRRKDLRKIDSLIRDLHSVTHPGAAGGASK